MSRREREREQCIFVNHVKYEIIHRNEKCGMSIVFMMRAIPQAAVEISLVAQVMDLQDSKERSLTCPKDTRRSSTRLCESRSKCLSKKPPLWFLVWGTGKMSWCLVPLWFRVPEWALVKHGVPSHGTERRQTKEVLPGKRWCCDKENRRPRKNGSIKHAYSSLLVDVKSVRHPFWLQVGLRAYCGAISMVQWRVQGEIRSDNLDQGLRAESQ